MTLLLTMLPFYLFGNLHCLGMCGPMALFLSHSPFRYYYLLGRLISFTLAGTIAGGLGEVIGIYLQNFYLSGLFSISVGLLFILSAYLSFFGTWGGIGIWLKQFVNKIEIQFHSKLDLQRAYPLFTFGFLTIALPCGQTLFVYSACALSGSVFIGTLNGFVFGVLTTPALFMAMQAKKQLRSWLPYYRFVAFSSLMLVGGLALLRGFADFGWIAHLNVGSIVIY